MRPLAIVTSWNRLELTKRMLTSLEPSLPVLDVVVVDNGSTDGSAEWLGDWICAHNGTHLYGLYLDENIGCPRALNQALHIFREPGQPVIKLDNDVLLPDGPQWVDDLTRLAQRDRYPLIALIGAYFEPWNTSRVRGSETWEGTDLYHVFPVIGHAVYHAGWFMDDVGYFDVLSPEHLYGFEDNLISVKAHLMGYATVAWQGWQVQDIQRHSALGGRADVDAHVAAMRPLYDARVLALRRFGSFYTGPDGIPAVRPQ